MPSSRRPSCRQPAVRGLILLSCGLYSNVIRILAPLTIPEAHLDEGLELLEQSLTEASAGATSAVA